MNLKSLFMLPLHAKSRTSGPGTDDDTVEQDPFGGEDYGLGDEPGADGLSSAWSDAGAGPQVDGLSAASPAPNGSASIPSPQGMALPAGLAPRGETMTLETTAPQEGASGEEPFESAGEAASQAKNPDLDSILDVFTEEAEVDVHLGNLVQGLKDLRIDDLAAECQELAVALKERAGC